MTDSNFSRPWTTPFLRKLLQAASAYGVPESVRMNAHDYSDIRMFCSFLDLNTDPTVLKTGFVSTFEGVRLFADRTISAGTMRVLDADGRDLIHSVASPDVISPVVFHSGSLAVCPDGLCIVQAVMHA